MTSEDVLSEKHMRVLLALLWRGATAELSIKGILSRKVACFMLQISKDITIPTEEIYVQAVRALTSV